jgi:hypothetical protein
MMIRKTVWALSFLIPLALIPISSSGDEANLALCLLIDNSGSMDWQGHDPEGLRWEAAKLVVDKTRKGDYVCLVDFSGKPYVLQPITLIDGSTSQKNKIKEKAARILSDRKLTDIEGALKLALKQLDLLPDEVDRRAVILLTDGEVDVVEGSPERKKAAAEMSKSAILSKTVPQFLSRRVPIYVVALTDDPDMDFLGKLAEYSTPPEHEKENHFFYSPTSTDLVVIFSKIFNQLRGVSVHTETYQVTGNEVKQIQLKDPFAKEVEFQFVHDPGINLDIKLTSPDGKPVKPYAVEKSYRLFAVKDPPLGTWRVEITTQRTTNITQSVAVTEDVKLEMPFAPKFKIGSPLEIIVNVKYRGELIDSSRFPVSEGGLFEIDGIWCNVIHPNGISSPEFELENRFGDYVYSYDGADIPGEYLVQAELRGSLNGQQAVVRSEKRVVGFIDKSTPKVVLGDLSGAWHTGKPIRIEAFVVENEASMHKPSLAVRVTGPDGSRTIHLQRSRRDKYEGEFLPSKPGLYMFTLIQDEDILVGGVAQQVKVLKGSGMSPRMAFILIGVVLIGGGAAFFYLKWSRRGMTVKEVEKAKPGKEIAEEEHVEEIEEEEEDLGVSATSVSPSDSLRDMPSEIEVVDNGEVVLKLALSSKTDAISGEQFYYMEIREGEVKFNDKLIVAGESAKAKDGDVLTLGDISLKMMTKANKVMLVSDLDVAGRMIEEFRDQEKIRWVIRLDRTDREEDQGPA